MWRDMGGESSIKPNESGWTAGDSSKMLGGGVEEEEEEEVVVEEEEEEEEERSSAIAQPLYEQRAVGPPRLCRGLGGGRSDVSPSVWDTHAGTPR
ncbi:unnamed protein product [Lota lota]